MRIWRVLIGLGIPFVGIVGLLPWAATRGGTVYGIPFLYAWIFGWFVATSACLYVAWALFDRDLDSRE